VKFRKKPVVVEAFNTKMNRELWPTWSRGIEIIGHTAGGPVLGIKTLEGMMQANAGDWIIRGILGEVYPCKPEIFEKTYERVEDQ
jgi:hypothetical protein